MTQVGGGGGNDATMGTAASAVQMRMTTRLPIVDTSNGRSSGPVPESTWFSLEKEEVPKTSSRAARKDSSWRRTLLLLPAEDVVVVVEA